MTAVTGDLSDDREREGGLRQLAEASAPRWLSGDARCPSGGAGKREFPKSPGLSLSIEPDAWARAPLPASASRTRRHRLRHEGA